MKNNRSIFLDLAHFIVYHLMLLSLYTLTQPLAALTDYLSPEDDIKFLDD